MTSGRVSMGLAYALLCGTVAAAQESYDPARFGSGTIPGQPPLASTGALVVVELEIAPSGIVTDSVVIDDGPPYTEAITKAARTWRFRPAREDGAAVYGKALVVGVFRPPVLMGAEPPKPTHVQETSEDLPYPTATTTPLYPPTALYEGTVFVEVEIDEGGQVREAVLRTPEDAMTRLRSKRSRSSAFVQRDGTE